MHLFKRLNVKSAFGLVVALAATGAAIAFWTGAGSGTATGTVDSGGTITVNGTIAPGIAPGLSRTVSFTATNPNTAAVTVGTISLVGVAVDAGHSQCDTGDFTLANVTSNQSVPAAATGSALAATGTLVFANTAVNQDACKGANLTLTLAST